MILEKDGSEIYLEYQYCNLLFITIVPCAKDFNNIDGLKVIDPFNL